MSFDQESFIRFVYGRWRKSNLKVYEEHPDAEELTCLQEGRLPKEKEGEMKRHILTCDACAASFALSLSLLDKAELPLPLMLSKYTKEKLGIKDYDTMELILRMKDKAIEVIRANGDILLGQELIPAAVLRSRNISDFSKEVILLKKMNNIKVQVKIMSAGVGHFGVSVRVEDKQGREAVRDLRVSLFKRGLEIESYLSDSGEVLFEYVPAGNYIIGIFRAGEDPSTVIIEAGL